ncbi:MAG: hypothetical protein GY765_11080, partial [bacterium]|nr:hypothetical protein [bacterium]
MLLEQLNDISTYKHFTGRRDILEEIHQTVSEKKSLVIKGTSGSGKTALTLQMITALKKKQFSLIVNTGKTHPEILLKKIAAKAIKKGIKDADNREITGSDTRQQILWFVENYLKKEKIMILFDDFHANLDNDGKFQSGRLKEFLLYLKDNLENADTFMLFASETDIPGFEALWLTAFSDEEYKKFLAGTNRLKQLSGKSREQMKFDIGCNPRSLILMDRIAARE